MYIVKNIKNRIGKYLTKKKIIKIQMNSIFDWDIFPFTFIRKLKEPKKSIWLKNSSSKMYSDDFLVLYNHLNKP